jgi:hypothetical protein
VIGGLITTALRAGLRLAGVRVLERKLGICTACGGGVWESDARTRIHGALFHADCAKYARRVIA